MIRLLSVLLVAAMSVCSFGATQRYTMVTGDASTGWFVISQKDQTVITQTSPSFSNGGAIGTHSDTRRGLWKLYQSGGYPSPTAGKRVDNVFFRFTGNTSPFTIHRSLRNIAPWNYMVNRTGNTNYPDLVAGVHHHSTVSFTQATPVYTNNEGILIDCSVSARRMILDVQYWYKTPTAPPVWIFKEVNPGSSVQFRQDAVWFTYVDVIQSDNPEGDLDDNGVINSADLAQFDTWSAAGAYHGYADMDDDGDIDSTDRALVQSLISANGDVNMDGIVNVNDVDAFQAIVRAGTPLLPSLDSNSNNFMDNPDVIALVTQKLRTLPGDVNGDCYVNATDYNIAYGNLFASNKYWTHGDVNNSTAVDTVDLNIISSYLNQAGDCSQ